MIDHESILFQQVSDHSGDWVVRGVCGQHVVCRRAGLSDEPTTPADIRHFKRADFDLLKANQAPQAA